MSKAHPTPTQEPDPVSQTLDLTVQDALNTMANMVRKRAKDRADNLAKDLCSIIQDFAKGYETGPDWIGPQYTVKGLGDSWPNYIQTLCDCLAAQVGEADVKRHVKTLSDRILKLQD